MSEDRLTAIEQRLAALERELAALRAALRAGMRPPYVSLNPNDPLEGHPLISKKLPPDELAAYEARRQKELGLEGVELIDLPTLRQMMIDQGVDPNSNEASREIIAMREE
jgi:hypothetical protein